jgi:hypothetical protein
VALLTGDPDPDSSTLPLRYIVWQNDWWNIPGKKVRISRYKDITLFIAVKFYFIAGFRKRRS